LKKDRLEIPEGLSSRGVESSFCSGVFTVFITLRISESLSAIGRLVCVERLRQLPVHTKYGLQEWVDCSGRTILQRV
jgi:hypothetical protein